MCLLRYASDEYSLPHTLHVRSLLSSSLFIVISFRVKTSSFSNDITFSAWFSSIHLCSFSICSLSFETIIPQNWHFWMVWFSFPDPAILLSGADVGGFSTWEVFRCLTRLIISLLHSGHLVFSLFNCKDISGNFQPSPMAHHILNVFRLVKFDHQIVDKVVFWSECLYEKLDCYRIFWLHDFFFYNWVKGEKQSISFAFSLSAVCSSSLQNKASISMQLLESCHLCALFFEKMSTNSGQEISWHLDVGHLVDVADVTLHVLSHSFILKFFTSSHEQPNHASLNDIKKKSS